MKFLEPRTSESAAIRFFERRRLRNLWGLLGRRSPATPGSSDTLHRVPYAELVWLPYYIIPIKLRSPRGESEITVSVEGYSGSVAVFQTQANTVEGKPQGETFRPRLDQIEATRLARKGLLVTIMGRRSGREKPVPQEVVRVDLLHYPFWVYYYERRRGRLDIRVLDAVNGSKPGPGVRASILNAFASAKRDAAF